jgi:hypothetical protein
MFAIVSMFLAHIRKDGMKNLPLSTHLDKGKVIPATGREGP